jgi:hypothetical protein
MLRVAAQSREEKLAKARREAEYAEMQACTFAPDVKRPAVRQPDGPVIVRGLGRFIETKELAKRLEEEHRCVRRVSGAFPCRSVWCVQVTSCRALPCILYRAMPSRVSNECSAVLCRAVPCRAVPCRAVPCTSRVVPCHAMLSCVLYRAMSCRVGL